MGFQRLLFHHYVNKQNKLENTDRNNVSAFGKGKLGGRRNKKMMLTPGDNNETWIRKRRL